MKQTLTPRSGFIPRTINQRLILEGAKQFAFRLEPISEVVAAVTVAVAVDLVRAASDVVGRGLDACGSRGLWLSYRCSVLLVGAPDCAHGVLLLGVRGENLTWRDVATMLD
jgi:hypothetical protein